MEEEKRNRKLTRWGASIEVDCYGNMPDNPKFIGMEFVLEQDGEAYPVDFEEASVLKRKEGYRVHVHGLKDIGCANKIADYLAEGLVCRTKGVNLLVEKNEDDPLNNAVISRLEVSTPETYASFPKEVLENSAIYEI